MHRVRAFGAVSAFAVASVACGDFLIDFETYPGGSPIPGGTAITDQFLDYGVASFSTTAPGGPVIAQISLAGQSGQNTLRGVGGDQDSLQPISIGLAMPFTGASILALDVGQAGLRLTAFDDADEIVATDQFVGIAAGFGSFDILSVTGDNIVRLEITQVFPGLGNDGYWVDDLFLVTPTPAAWTLLLVGAVARRRRR